MTQVELENLVMTMLLKGEHKILAALRQQAKFLKVKTREQTGVGFFTEFSIMSGAVRLESFPTFHLGNVIGTTSNLANGIGFLLFITKGVITMLEGYTYGEPWPSEFPGLVLKYWDAPSDLPES